MILYENGEEIGRERFKYIKGSKHRINVSVNMKKLEFLGFEYKKPNVITIRFIQLDYAGKYKTHRDIKVKFDFLDIIRNSMR